jgi:hypothetical protein
MSWTTTARHRRTPGFIVLSLLKAPVGLVIATAGLFLVGLIGFVIATWWQARYEGKGFFRCAARSAKAVLSFIFWFL